MVGLGTGRDDLVPGWEDMRVGATADLHELSGCLAFGPDGYNLQSMK